MYIYIYIYKRIIYYIIYTIQIQIPNLKQIAKENRRIKRIVMIKSKPPSHVYSDWIVKNTRGNPLSGMEWSLSRDVKGVKDPRWRSLIMRYHLWTTSRGEHWRQVRKKKEREKKERRGGEKRKSGVIRKQAAKARTGYCTDAKVYPAFNASHCIIPVIYKAPGVIIRNRNRENSWLFHGSLADYRRLWRWMLHHAFGEKMATMAPRWPWNSILQEW